MVVKADIVEQPSADYAQLAAQLTAAKPKDVYQTIVSAPFDDKLTMAYLFLGFICVYMVDEEMDEIQLMAASGTEEYRLAVENYNFNLTKFRLCFDVDKDNTIVRAIATNKPQGTDDWLTLSRKNKSAEAVRFNQANSGIAYTAIYPFTAKRRGALMYNFYQYAEDITDEQRDFMETYTKLVSEQLDLAVSR
jgi:hypothetical protein